MILDAGTKFHRNQAGYNQLAPALEGELVTATALLSGILDRLSASDTGAGEAIFPFAKVSNAANFNPVTSAQFQVIGADNLDLADHLYASLVNPVVLSDSGVILTANLVAGSLVPMPPLKPGVRKRCLYLYVIVAGGNATTGAIVAGLVDRNARAQMYLQQTGTPLGHNL